MVMIVFFFGQAVLNALSLVLRTLCPYCLSLSEDNEIVDRLTA